MDNNVRLLVHAGASSTRQDDDQRVAQAAAYLDLQPALVSRRILVWPLEGDGSDGISQQRNSGPSDEQQDETIEEPDSTTFIDDTQLAYTSLESQLIPSSARNLRPTPVKRRYHELSFSSTAPVPSKAIRVSGSSSLRPRSLEQETCIEHLDNEIDRSLLSTGQAEPAERQNSQSDPKEKTQTTEGTVTSNDTTSELPNSYSLGDLSDGIHSRPHLSERSISDPGPSPAKQGTLVAHREQVPAKEVLSCKPQRPLGRTSDATPIQHPAVPVAATTRVSVEGANNPQRKSASQDLSTSIEPAGPVTSVEPFTTHVTPTLQKLASNPELSATFLPIAIERDLSVHERGHWEVQCSNWNTDLQTSFWKTLEAVVGAGKAGWGVRCTRGPEVPLCSQSSQQHGGNAEQISEACFGPVRVYCWGEIAKHIYLLLFVASNSKVRKLGLRWIDAQSVVVLQMRKG